MRRIYSLSILVIATACSPALPEKSLPHEVSRYAVHAESSAAEARRHAEATEELHQLSRRLYEEAEKLTARAEAARAYCEEVKKKIPKQRVVYIEKKVEQPKEGEEGEGETDAESGAPKYSPSDAPLKK